MTTDPITRLAERIDALEKRVNALRQNNTTDNSISTRSSASQIAASLLDAVLKAQRLR